MPVARVMNMPDGSTPVPQMGGGDVNGTLARSILISQAGSGMGQTQQPPKVIFQSSQLGIVGAVLTQDQIPVTGASTLGG